MTALIYVLTKDSVMISMDTLTTGIYMEGENRDVINMNFTTKMYPLPHLNAVICGMGNAELKRDWYDFARTDIISRDITYLDNLATEKLLEFDKKYKLKSNTSIYQFGYDEDIDEFVGFVYSTDNGYKSQRLEKMEDICKIDIIPMISPDKYKETLSNSKFDTVEGFEDFFIKVMKEQKRNDDLCKPSDRAGIGGDVHLLHMTKDYYSYKTIHRFDDYDSVYEYMCITRLK